MKLDRVCGAGSIILAADGSLSLKVKSCGDDFVITEAECFLQSAVLVDSNKRYHPISGMERQVMNDIAIGEKKNMNLPGVKVDLPVLQEPFFAQVKCHTTPMFCHGFRQVMYCFRRFFESLERFHRLSPIPGQGQKRLAGVWNSTGMESG